MGKRIAKLLVLIALSLTTNALVSAADQSESLEILVGTLSDVDDDAVRGALLRGMIDGLAGRRNLPAPKGWDSLKKALNQSSDPSVREHADRLAQIFGDPEAIERAMETLSDEKSPISARRAALKALLLQRHTPVLAELKSLIDQPELQIDAIRAYSVFESADAAKLLLSRYPKLNVQARRAVIETLATRKQYALALVAALREQLVDRNDIPVYVARTMREIVRDEFTEVYGEVKELEKDSRQLIAKYKRMITPEAMEEADPRRGRVVFRKTCAACHLLYGVGGKIGPDLTGSNRANLDYILLNSIAPSEDVPEGYRMVIIQTVDGRVLSGVIGAEDAQRVVLKTVDQPEVVIAKEDIEARKLSEKSMMPDGQLQQLTKQQVFDLLKYLRTTEQVEPRS